MDTHNALAVTGKTLLPLALALLLLLQLLLLELLGLICATLGVWLLLVIRPRRQRHVDVTSRTQLGLLARTASY